MIKASHYVVVASPDELTGTVVEAGARLQQLAAQGTLFLPVDPVFSGNGGSPAASAFQLAHYGSGVAWERGAFSRGCPLNVYLPTGSARVAWMFEVEKQSPIGSQVNLTLCGDATERGVADVQTDESFKKSWPIPGGSVVAGLSRVRAAPQSFATVCLGGTSHYAARVRWLAATVLPL